MNRRSSGLLFSRALVGFLNHKSAEGLSPTTLTSYEHDLKLCLSKCGDVEVEGVTRDELRSFFAWLRSAYKPRRISGDDSPLSPKTVRNVWASLSSFFTWVSDEFESPNPMKGVPAPRFERAPVAPFSRDDVEELLKACVLCRKAKTTYRRGFSMRRVTARRDQAIILTLLDTGLRASELCSVTVGDVDLRTGRVDVKHGRAGGAKGGKGRVVYLGKAARRSVWRYLAEREDGEDPDAPLFSTKFDRKMNKDSLRLLITGLGKKAGVKKCHPHRFRHTFAITYLRSGGDVFTLQALLGHSTLDMVRHYALIAEIDIQQAHRRASPADNWRL